MKLTLEGELAQQLVGLAKDDGELALQLALELCETLAPEVLGPYVLPGEALAAELTRRLSEAPAETMAELAALLPAPAAGEASAAKAPPVRRPVPREPPFGPEVVGEKSDLVLAYLAEFPWSDEAALGQAAGLETEEARLWLLHHLLKGGAIQATERGAEQLYAPAGFAAAPGEKPKQKKSKKDKKKRKKSKKDKKKRKKSKKDKKKRNEG